MRKKLLFLLFAISLCLSLHVTALATASNANTTVYVTNTGDKYHVRSCHYLRSVNKFTLEQAVANGKTPCSYCNPPIPNFSCTLTESVEQAEDSFLLFETQDPFDTEPTFKHTLSSTPQPSSSTDASTDTTTRKTSSVSFSTDFAGVLIIVVVVGYFLLRLFIAKPSSQRAHSSFNADLWSLDKKQNSNNSPPKETQTLNELQILGMPDDTTLGISGLPREKNCNGTSPWGDKYTVWYSANGSKYHTFWCEWRSDIPVNVVNCTREPCKVCKPTLPDLNWYYAYKESQSENESTTHLR